MEIVRHALALMIIALFVFVCLRVLNQAQMEADNRLLVRLLVIIAGAAGAVLSFYF